MKKYKVNYLKKFVGKTNGVTYLSLELGATTPSKDKETGELLGYKTYGILCKAENFPKETKVGDFVECFVSFDKETGKPFACGFNACQAEEPVDADLPEDEQWV